MRGICRIDRERLPAASAGLSGLAFCLLLVTGCGSKQEAARCAAHDECWSSSITDALGRCAPKEMACDHGTCTGSCAQPCETIQADVNPCDDAALICNDARDLNASASGFVHCTGVEIPCNNVEQCPLYLPPAPAGSEAAWSCEAGVCRYPGFNYKYQLESTAE